MAEIMAIGQNETCLEMSPQILQPPLGCLSFGGYHILNADSMTSLFGGNPAALSNPFSKIWKHYVP